MISMTSIKKECRRELVGIKSLLIVLIGDVAYLQQQLNLPLATLTLQNGKTAFAIDFDLKSAKWSFTDRDTPGGTIEEHTVKCGVKRLRTEVQAIRQFLQHRKFHVVLQLHDGSLYFLPKSRLLVQGEVGSLSERNGYVFNFAATTLQPCKSLGTGNWDIGGSMPTIPQDRKSVV